MYNFAILLFLVLFWILYGTNYLKKSVHTFSLDLKGNITALHISDIHGKPHFINGSLSENVLKCKPDILFITGDLISRKKITIRS